MGKAPKVKEAKIKEDAFKYDQAAIDALKSQYSDLYKQESGLGSTVATGSADNIKALQAAAAGQTPSIAEAQLRAAQDRNLAQQLATAQSFRGGNAASQQRQLLRNQGQAGTQLAQDAALAKLQEQQQNRQALTQALQSERSLTSANTQNISGAQMGIQDALRNAKVQAEQERLTSARNRIAQQQQANQANNQMIGSLVGTGASLLTAGATGGGSLIGNLFSGGAKSAAEKSLLGGKYDAGVEYNPDNYRSKYSGFPTANQGGVIEGKAAVDHDSEANDVVPVLASPGEVVIPRSAAKDEDSAKAFLKALYAKESTKKKLKKTDPKLDLFSKKKKGEKDLDLFKKTDKSDKMSFETAMKKAYGGRVKGKDC